MTNVPSVGSTAVTTIHCMHSSLAIADERSQPRIAVSTTEHSDADMLCLLSYDISRSAKTAFRQTPINKFPAKRMPIKLPHLTGAMTQNALFSLLADG